MKRKGEKLLVTPRRSVCQLKGPERRWVLKSKLFKRSLRRISTRETK